MKLPPVGTRVREFGDERLFHVRGHVDGRVVMRCWSARRGWLYAIERPAAFETGGFVVERKRQARPGRKDRR